MGRVVDMFDSLFKALFGCSHQHTTFPLTPAKKMFDARHAGDPKPQEPAHCDDCFEGCPKCQPSKFEYVNLGDVCRGRIGMQAQYGCRYAKPGEICADLRYKGTPDDYHFMKIYAGDVEEFVRRVLALKAEQGW